MLPHCSLQSSRVAAGQQMTYVLPPGPRTSFSVLGQHSPLGLDSSGGWVSGHVMRNVKDREQCISSWRIALCDVENFTRPVLRCLSLRKVCDRVDPPTSQHLLLLLLLPKASQASSDASSWNTRQCPSLSRAIEHRTAASSSNTLWSRDANQTSCSH